MNRYTVLLADDEEEVIRVMIKKIKWEELGFEIIGYADNGMRALELAKELQPDVVMTDIRMPYMDGITLAGHIRKEVPDCHIVFFTGFDEFEYAKEAIHLNVDEYILKPVNSVELTEIFEKLKHKLDEEISRRRNIATLEQYYQDSLPLLRANFYTALIEGTIKQEELKKYSEDTKVSFTGPTYCCVVIHVSLSQEQFPEGMSRQLLSVSVQKVAEERFSEEWRARFFTYRGNTVMIAQLDEEEGAVDLTDACDRFCRYAGRILGAVITVGIGTTCNDLLEIASSYSGAREAVSYRAVYGAGAINIREIVPKEVKRDVSPEDDDLAGIFREIRLGNEQDVERAVDAYLNASPLLNGSLEQHDISTMEMVSGLYRFAGNNALMPLEERDGENDVRRVYEELFDLEPKMLRAWMIKTSLKIRKKLLAARSDSSKNIVARAKELIHLHYADEDISLEAAGEELGISNAYLSTVFKKETGKSFISYLTEYRMTEAARLLTQTEDKSYVIAKRVGYADANYFSYVFKKQYGVSPSKYRTEYVRGE